MTVSIGKLAKELGVHIETLRRLDKKGILKPHRTSGNQRRYNLEDAKRIFFNLKGIKVEKKIILYARVSSQNQKDDLQTQIDRLESYATAKGYCYEIISDIGSGLNYNRRGFNKLINMIENNEIELVIVNYKDRLVRFGYELIDFICKCHGVNIEIINKTDEFSFEQELVDDMI